MREPVAVGSLQKGCLVNGERREQPQRMTGWGKRFKKRIII
jgi:hypothetical protein